MMVDPLVDFTFDSSLDPQKQSMICHMTAKIRPGVVLTDAGGRVKPGLKANFQEGELHVLKGQTFKVVYLNAHSITLEPVDIPILKGRQG